MSVDKISGLDDWNLEGLPKDALVDASIHFAYPPIEELKALQPTQRVKRVNELMQLNIQAVVAQCQPVTYSPSPSKHRPRGMKCCLPLSKLEDLRSMEQVTWATITGVAGGKKIVRRKRKAQQFFCVRMTAAIQIEDVSDGLQSYEDRFVLIKAYSSEDAYNRVQAASSQYAEPYLNEAGYLVRWKVESLDDCYVTGITTLSDFTNPAGVEVFSVIQRRRITPERVWDGKTE
ncbi:DUF4288 domain-containing protein [Hymenobacter fodinae]|uniref:DUF4288 domain-containing protein n=1 Tax=Hymenobacter fodinae TaxID=2510796 RepID=A0A4Z0P996_9BACT|nr:DUF4288 domain-containing protein [Hymenobacter fodinae]TGE07976.1 DUF4288 domain-containing protein [Hymenobacter fodinae]